MLTLIFWLISSFTAPDACIYEDGSEMLDNPRQEVCIWDASESGNNFGDSFIVMKSSDNTLIYLYEDGTLTQ